MFHDGIGMNLKYSLSNCIKMANQKESSLACVLTTCTLPLSLIMMNTEGAHGSEPRKILLCFCSKLLSLNFQYHKKISSRNSITILLLECHKSAINHYLPT